MYPNTALRYGGPIDEKFKCRKSSVFLHFTAIFTVFKYLANDSRPLILCGIMSDFGRDKLMGGT